jgi:Carboxypeptidase regulatory-like domain
MNSVRSVIALILLMAFSATLHAQALIIHEKPVRLRHLSGTVVDPTGATIAYTLIELRDATDHHVLASTFGDAKGKFFFEDKKRGTKLEIRVSRTGFQSVQYEIVVGIVGWEHIRVVLPPAA